MEVKILVIIILKLLTQLSQFKNNAMQECSESLDFNFYSVIYDK